jgi:serine/threonine-protein kinase HipA
MKDILQLLKGSDVPDDDLATFMRANIVFWLLGATDGHAKNFSIFLTSGGQFHMTPLYDVLSAQPSLDANQIQRKQFRLAMSVGKSRHYAMDEILPRHFIQTAEIAGVGAGLVRSIFEDLAENAEQAIEVAIDELPDGFPEAMTNSIRTAMSHRIDFLKEA